MTVPTIEERDRMRDILSGAATAYGVNAWDVLRLLDALEAAEAEVARLTEVLHAGNVGG